MHSTNHFTKGTRVRGTQSPINTSTGTVVGRDSSSVLVLWDDKDDPAWESPQHVEAIPDPSGYGTVIIRLREVRANTIAVAASYERQARIANELLQSTEASLVSIRAVAKADSQEVDS